MSTYILNATRFFSRIPSMGPGDADVYTKKGRGTHILVETQEPQFTSDKLYVQIPLTYEIREMKNADTTLKLTETVKISVPHHLRNKNLTLDNIQAEPYHYSAEMRGQNHRFNALPHQPNSCIYEGFYRFDGPGEDDKGNAALMLSFRIPISYK